MDFGVLILFWLLCGWAARDWYKGTLPLWSLIPLVLLPAWGWTAFVDVYIPVFLALAVVWLAVKGLARRFPQHKEILRFGFGDVLVVPYAMAVSVLSVPFFGLAVFAVVLGLQFLFWRPGMKAIRFLPWMVFPTAITVFFGLFL